MPTGYTAITAAKIQDASGNKLASGRVTFYPVDTSGRALSAVAGGGGGIITTRGVSFLVVNGAITTDTLGNTPQVADSTLTTPVNLCYSVKVTDASGAEIQGPGYGLVQPSGSTFSLDSITPNQPAQAVVQTGPRGLQGIQGPTGPAGTTTASGSNGAFNVPGALTFGATGAGNLYLHSSTTSNGTLTETDQFGLNYSSTGVGCAVGALGGWTVFKPLSIAGNFAVRGIAQSVGLVHVTTKSSDDALIYGYMHHDAGHQVPADEGKEGIVIQVLENAGYFHGTVAATTGTGDTNPTLSFASGNDWLSDGFPLLDTSKGQYTGQFNNGASNALDQHANLPSLIATGVQSHTIVSGEPVVTSVSLPILTAWGLLQNGIGKDSTSADVAVSVTVSVNLFAIGGTQQPFVPGLAMAMGTAFYEIVNITSAPAPVAGVQTLTLMARYAQPTVALSQGPLAGHYLSFDAEVTGTGQRPAYPIFGSVDGVNLGFGAYNSSHGLYGVPQPGVQFAGTSGASSAWHEYPGAEIIKATNADGSMDCVLAPNNVAWAVGDTVEALHGMTNGGATALFVKQQYTSAESTAGSPGLEIDMHGSGISSATPAIDVNSTALQSQYFASGGALDPPDVLYAGGGGDFSFGIEMYAAPIGRQGSFRGGATSGAAIGIGYVPSGRNPLVGLFTFANSQILQYNSTGGDQEIIVPSGIAFSAGTASFSSTSNSGSSTAGSYTANGTVQLTGSGVVPVTSHTGSVGSSGNTWSEAWVDNYNGGKITLSADVSARNLYSQIGSTNVNASSTFGGGNVVVVNGTGTITTFEPGSGVTFNESEGWIIAILAVNGFSTAPGGNIGNAVTFPAGSRGLAFWFGSLLYFNVLS